MKKAICYIRSAPYEAHDDALSEQAQREALKGYCAMRQLHIEGWFVDVANASSTLEQRPEATSMFNALEQSSKPVALVCLGLDRLTSSATTALELLARCRTLQVDLHLLSVGGQSVELSSMMGPWVVSMLEGVANMERLAQRESSSPELVTHAPKHARDIRGSVPYGYKLDAEGILLIEEPQEQLALRELLRLHHIGYSMRRITAKLNEGQHPARGQRWHVTTVARLLKRLLQAAEDA